VAARLTLAQTIQLEALDMPNWSRDAAVADNDLFRDVDSGRYVRLTALRSTRFCSVPAESVMCLEHARTGHVSILLQGWTIA
jgi:hypothetical protein